MSSDCSPLALKEMTLQQLMLIRERLLSPDSLAAIDELPPERQHEITLTISRAQKNYVKLQKATLLEVNNGMKRNEKDLLEGISSLQASVEQAAAIEQFMKKARGFIRIVESIFRLAPPVV